MKHQVLKRAALCGAIVIGWALGAPALADEVANVPLRAPVMYDPTPSTLRVPAPRDFLLEQFSVKAVQATVNVNYLPNGTTTTFGDTCITWSPSAQAAFSYAAGVWASQLQSPVPITIDACYASNMASGVLGSAGPTGFRANFAGAPATNVWYPAALANALSGTDLNGSTSEIQAAFNANYTWYYGTDGNTPITEIDFVSVVLHELGHGLGFIGSMTVSGGSGSWGESSPYPFRYDQFTQNGAGQGLLNTGVFANPSVGLATALQSGAVYFSGTNANAGNGGARVPLYAPGTWQEGSSYSHLAESFNGTANALMTYSIGAGESVHAPGPVMLGMFQDMGWQLQNSSTADLVLSETASANPVGTGKDVVFTMTATNNGPGTATGVVVDAAYDAAATVIWASPGCTKQNGVAVYACNVGTLANGASTSFKLVLRKGAAGSTFVNAGTVSSTTDPNAANNQPTMAVSVVTSPAAAAVQRYRLYSPITQEHLYTTDLNEYNVLGAGGGWTQEGTIGHVLNNPGVFNTVTATPYYRLYNTTTNWHHWTTDPNEYYTLIQYPNWNGEGVDGYILPSVATGATQLYRLLYPDGRGLHHWTIDATEYGILIGTYGWVGEGGSGFVIQ